MSVQKVINLKQIKRLALTICGEVDIIEEFGYAHTCREDEDKAKSLEIELIPHLEQAVAKLEDLNSLSNDCFGN